MGSYSCFNKHLDSNNAQVSVDTDHNQQSITKPPIKTHKPKLSKKKTFNFDRSNFIHMKTKSLFDEYEIKEKLGEGAYGCVYKVQHKTTGFLRAVKAIKRKHVDSTAFGNEIGILKTVDHPNIIRLYDCYYDNNYYYMVEEYCSAGDLYDYIRKQKFFSEKKAANIMFQLLSAVNYLHKKNIVHRDLKPENIVFIKTGNSAQNSNQHNNIQSTNRSQSNNNNNNNKTKLNQKQIDQEEIFIKLIDFGTSVHLKSGNLTQELGTIYYIAPEVFKNNYNERADVWSCGIILYIMLCGHPPFCGRKEEDIKHKIINSPLQFLPKDFNKVSSSAISYVKKLLTYDASKRPSAEEALENEWLNRLRKEEGEDHILESGVLENLAKFTSAVALQKVTLSFIANQVNMNEEIKKLKSEFDKIDVNKDGMISKDELIKCLDAINPHEEAVKKANEIFEEIDFNNDGSINFSEFLTLNIKKEKLMNEDMLQKGFKLFDLDGNGYITIEELKETIPVELQNNSAWIEIVKEVDQNGDCQIDFNEFKAMMEKIANL